MEDTMKRLEMIALKGFVSGFFTHMIMFGDFIYEGKSNLGLDDLEIRRFKVLLDELSEGKNNLNDRFGGILGKVDLNAQCDIVRKFHERLFPFFDLGPKEILQADIEMRVSFLSGYLDGLFLVLPISDSSISPS